jgi:hypothetical protein
MGRHILLLSILFVSILSHAQSNFLKETLKNISSAPSYLIVKVRSPSYEGDAAIFSINFYLYYKTIKKRSIKGEKYFRLAYGDIKKGKYFIVSDEDMKEEYYNVNQKHYYFEKIVINENVLNVAKKGIEFFIRTYFDDKGDFNPSSSYNPDDFYTIVKVMFDSGIRTGIGSEWSNYHIQDSRFYKKYEDGKVIEYVYPERARFVIPPEYRDSKE